jgi:ubiquinone/menaquinone biosynthesis C-methylase UbiE
MLDYQNGMAFEDAALVELDEGIDDGRDSLLREALTVARTRAEIDVDQFMPDYMKEVYYWAYLDPRNVRLLDHNVVVDVILWFQHQKLQRATFAELEPGQNVLMPASVYGDFCSNLARHLGSGADLEILDIAPIQVKRCREKVASLPWVCVNRGNAADLGDRLVDSICCYFLLHEVPLDYKYAIVQELLDHVGPRGKVVFVDYHKPHWAHPLKPITSLVFDTLEPFAKELWRHPIEEFAEGDTRFSWRQQSFFGGLFQMVVAERTNAH